MYIAKVKTGTSKNGTTYYTHRLLSTHKVGITGKVQQRLVLNLGAGYSFPKELWPNLCERIEEIMLGTPKLFLTSPEVEQEAQRIAHLINQKNNLDVQEKTPLAGYFLEDIECMKHRSIGAEYVSLHAAEQLQLSSILSSLDFTEEQIHWCLALIIGRMVNPGS